MKNLIIRLIVNTLSVFFAAWILGDHVELRSFGTAILVALVLAVLNLTVRPLLILLTIPATILTFGLFLFVVNALVIMAADWMVPNFIVDGFWWALVFSLLVSFINSLLFKLGGDQAKGGPPHQAS